MINKKNQHRYRVNKKTAISGILADFEIKLLKILGPQKNLFTIFKIVTFFVNKNLSIIGLIIGYI